MSSLEHDGLYRLLVEEGVARLTLNRPESMNAINYALRAELKDSGVTVTCLMPGATETEFFERADLMDTKVGVEKKQPADEVAKVGFEAMMRGDGGENCRVNIRLLMPRACCCCKRLARRTTE